MDGQLRSYLDRTVDILSEKEDKIWHNLYEASYQRTKLNTVAQLKALVVGLDLASDAPDSIKWRFLDELAMTYRKDGTRNQEKALKYINEALDMKLKNGASRNELGKSYYIKANVFLNAIDLDSNQYKALEFYKLANEYNTRETTRVKIKAAIATVNLSLGKLDSVESYLLEAIEYKRTNKQAQSEASSLANLMSYYIEVDAYEQAFLIFDTLAPRVTRNEWKHELRSLIHGRIYLEEKRENWKEAVFWKDSLVSLNTIIDAGRLDEKIAQHDLEFQLDEEKDRTYRNRLWLFILLGATGTLCFVLFGLFKYFKLRKTAVLKELEAIKMKAAFDATKAKMEGEQLERESIASVLHDQVASLLTAADMHLKVAQKKDPDAAALSKAGNIIKDINNQVRDISHQLVSPTLTKFGLEAGIDTLTKRIDSGRLSIDYYANLGADRYGSRIETFVFQSCSELIQNVIKHSKADNCQVILTKTDKRIILEVTDNGDNSDVNKSKPTGMGLAHIYNRAEAFGGDFHFELKNEGAFSQLTLPCTPLDKQIT